MEKDTSQIVHKREKRNRWLDRFKLFLFMLIVMPLLAGFLYPLMYSFLVKDSRKRAVVHVFSYTIEKQNEYYSIHNTYAQSFDQLCIDTSNITVDIIITKADSSCFELKIIDENLKKPAFADCNGIGEVVVKFVMIYP